MYAFTVLSGMGSMERMKDNLSYMKDFQPLTKKEHEAVKKVREINGKASDCIYCSKCEKICPQHLEIRKLLESVAETFEQKAEA